MKRKHLNRIIALWEGVACRRLSQACLSLVMLILPACSDTLPATATAERCKSTSGESNAWYCHIPAPQGLEGCGAQGGCAHELKGAAPYVGWGECYYEGTEPAPCPEWASGAKRAFVNFNIFPSLKDEWIFSATLKWDSKSDKWEKGVADTYAGEFYVCWKSLQEATGAWGFDSPGNLIVAAWGQPGNAYSQDVTSIVRKWAKGDQEYFGFFFTPTREDLPTKVKSRFCYTKLNNLRLEVTHLNVDAAAAICSVFPCQ